MKTYFGKSKCPSCGESSDSTYRLCPHCGTRMTSGDFYDFEHHVHCSIPWQVFYFLFGFIGLQIIGFFVALIVEISYATNVPGQTAASLTDAMRQPWAQMLINGPVYLIIAGVFFLVLWRSKKLKEVFRSFKNGKAIIAGVIGFAAIMFAQIGYNFIVNVIFALAKYEAPGVNQNESSIRAISVTFPALSLFVFGIVGPFCEEITYRVGLFGFTTRFGKALGYVLTSIIFGAIHFNWAALWTPSLQSTLVEEFVNLPSYIGSGAALCFLYDRFGFSASYVAHSINNLYSVTMTIISQQ